jgi:hypothetical protein
MVLASHLSKHPVQRKTKTEKHRQEEERRRIGRGRRIEEITKKRGGRKEFEQEGEDGEGGEKEEGEEITENRGGRKLLKDLKQQQ